MWSRTGKSYIRNKQESVRLKTTWCQQNASIHENESARKRIITVLCFSDCLE